MDTDWIYYVHEVVRIRRNVLLSHWVDAIGGTQHLEGQSQHLSNSVVVGDAWTGKGNWLVSPRECPVVVTLVAPNLAMPCWTAASTCGAELPDNSQTSTSCVMGKLATHLA